MKTTSIATLVALLSSSSASTVTLETTACLDPSIPLQRLSIAMNLSGPVARDLPQVCGLRIVSASPGIDISTITCQAFRDVVGTQPGSAVFTYAKPALIATNPVQEKAVKCTYPVPRDANMRRQNNNGTVTSQSESASLRVSTLFLTSTLAVSGNASTVSSTSLASASASSSGNGTSTPTLSATLTPSVSASASQTSGPPKGNTAGRIGMSAGAVFGVIVAMVM